MEGGELAGVNGEIGVGEREREKGDLLVFSEEEKKKIWEGGCGTSVLGGPTVRERHERAKTSNQEYGMGNPLEGDSMFRY